MGFATLEDVKDRYEEIIKDKNIIARKVGNGCILEASPDYLLKTTDMIQKGLVTQKDVEKMKKMMAEAYVGFEKFLKSKKSAEFDRVGIYCINSSTAITIKGINYPAFRVSLSTALQLLAKANMKVGLKGVGLVPATQLLNAPQKVYESIMISPTNTGAFLRIGK